MVGGIGDPLVANPGAFVRAQFEQAAAMEQANGSGAFRPTASAIPGVQERFAPYLTDPKLRSAVPCLSDIEAASENANLPDGTLVRYVGMVRDMLNPEYFTGAYKKGSGADARWCTTKYLDFAEDDLSQASDTVMWERRPLFCVAVVGENKWVRETPTNSASAMSSDAGPGGSSLETRERKRRQGESDLMDCDQDVKRRTDAEAMPPPPPVQPAAQGGSSCACCPGPCPSAPQEESPMDTDQPQRQPQRQGAGGESVNQNQGEMPVLIKVYETSGHGGTLLGLEGVKLNDVVEVLGVLGVDPRLAVFQSGQFQEGDQVTEEDVANNPPASQVPRIHAIMGRKVNCYEDLLSHRLVQAASKARAQPEFLPSARARVVDYLARDLKGDRVAAEVLLLHLLISCRRTQGSADSAAVGKHALNLTGVDAAAFAKIASRVSSLVPRSASLDLTIAKLNAWPLWPRKDYSVSRLVGGPLLLADHTHLLVDETLLVEGQLAPVGVQNFQALKGLVENQSLEVDFQFYRLPIHCNVPVTVLSQTKSLLPCDTCVSLRPANGAGMGAEAEEGEEGGAHLEEMRAYLAQCWVLDFEIGEEVGQRIQEDFVEQRQKDPSGTSAATLGRTLTLARVFSQSLGETKLSVATYQKLKDLLAAVAARQ